MDLRQLEYFVAVAELGSFTRASAALDVTQPALSRQVRALETEFRQHLLTRNGRGVVPTDAGRQLVELGRGLLHQAQRLTEELGHARGALVGRVVIGLPPSLSRALAVPLTRAFTTRMPDAELSIGTALTRNPEESLTLRQLDLAVLFGPSAGLDLELEPLAEDPLRLVHARRRAIRGVTRRQLPATARKPLALAELAELPLIIPRRPNAFRMRIESELARIGKRPRIALEVDSISAILDLVDDGAGCAVLSSLALDLASAGAELANRPLGDPPLESTLVLATSARRPRTDTLDEVMTIVRELLIAAGTSSRSTSARVSPGRHATSSSPVSRPS